MTTDRREDVRQRLDELEATVSGLTQELVEANDRIRELEERLEAEDEAETEEEPAEETAATDGGDDGGNTDREDDIIVA